MFHVKHKNKGYDSTNFFRETFGVIASIKVKKVIYRLWKYRFHITLFNLLTPSLAIARNVSQKESAES